MVAFETTSHKGITSPSDLSKDLKSGAMSQLTAFIKKKKQKQSFPNLVNDDKSTFKPFLLKITVFTFMRLRCH